MLKRLKYKVYFPVAGYFGFFAKVRLRRWKPQVVIVTGSNGKTTALHMIEARLGRAARYSHHRNSAFGICFDILGLGDASDSRWHWLLLALLAPFRIFVSIPKEAIYVAECDADRPGEGDFLSRLLRPEVVIWLNRARTHSENYAEAAKERAIGIDEVIAHEFGYFLERAAQRAIINGDDAHMVERSARSKAKIEKITEAADLGSWDVSTAGTTFVVRGKTYTLPYLLPRDVFRAIAASESVAAHFSLPPGDLASFVMPPGRSSIFRGVKNTTIIDSSYNINAGSFAAILAMVGHMDGEKWLVLGDMTEQGAYEKEEHEKVARMLVPGSFARVVLVGPRMRAFALPILRGHRIRVGSFSGPKEALDYLEKNISGAEVLVFKGARFLEGIIEHMLADPQDAKKLCRREPRWQERRRKWGL